MSRTNNLPPPTTIMEAAEVCERNARNILMNLLDCADCQDCSESELAIYKFQSALWSELAGDLHALHKAQTEPAEPKKDEFRQCQKCGEAAHRHPYRNCDEAE